jgi:REP element-mobilizing transposase RayT
MTFNPDIHHRRSIRLREYDYASTGACFVTVCTHERECLFGWIDGEVMAVNDAGRVVETVWHTLPTRFPDIQLDEFVVMPNHIHFLIFLVGTALAPPHPDSTGKNIRGQTTNQGAAEIQGAASSAPTLGAIMRAFKSISAIEINRLLRRQGQPLWQRNYYERVVRDESELNGFREYIQFNPTRWKDDENNNLT